MIDEDRQEIKKHGRAFKHFITGILLSLIITIIYVIKKQLQISLFIVIGFAVSILISALFYFLVKIFVDWVERKFIIISRDAFGKWLTDHIVWPFGVLIASNILLLYCISSLNQNH